MAGIYLHIPFCKQACSYCNFHFSTVLKTREAVLHSMLLEIEYQKHFFGQHTVIETIYFGGGTPSILSIRELKLILKKIEEYFPIAEQPEITLEANPDDLSLEYLTALKNETSINRFSIGIQSFWDADLRYMNRAHNATQAEECIKRAQDIGFENLSVDLIYGTPTLSNEQWQKNLHTIFNLKIPHISCYALTIEEKTALASSIKKRKIIPPKDEQMVAHFSILTQEMNAQEYIQYEISNFCKNPYFAKHNTNYWKEIPYLGIGASAHSFDGKNRYWNISNNALYVQKINEHKQAFEIEILSTENKYNEYVMTGIRTIFGIDKNKIKLEYGEKYFAHFMHEIAPFLAKNWVIESNGIYTLNHEGKLFCDYITEHLFME
ncbi:MAG TPA: radical SAM family heme chaperone HemW [Chitinophagales bacterium]|jgi:oxygen-independent coproporphyrinogen-3 oxidase|nr:radical SAM family heme chaperone HemW [Chitinophagales bacterium]HQW79247.1 radical SAM family heme chaperone HemW [Chitinophagales bacterium]HRB19520.1 radical SAM family heme chaperone HemW [Chitinophagales bacterium]HRB66222.1 radical SAM family heme chaperone HemW [Chitinophagales bacterium]HRB91760.1 radical SAM family heme chaperone HemW [Chitinophagales bacterium]